MVEACMFVVDRIGKEKIDGVEQGEWLEWLEWPMEGQDAGARHQPQARRRHLGASQGARLAEEHVSTINIIRD